jgi:hypothetical protein
MPAIMRPKPPHLKQLRPTRSSRRSTSTSPRLSRKRRRNKCRWSSLTIRRSPHPEEVLENDATLTNFLTSLPRWG